MNWRRGLLHIFECGRRRNGQNNLAESPAFECLFFGGTGLPDAGHATIMRQIFWLPEIVGELRHPASGPPT